MEIKETNDRYARFDLGFLLRQSANEPSEWALIITNVFLIYQIYSGQLSFGEVLMIYIIQGLVYGFINTLGILLYKGNNFRFYSSEKVINFGLEKTKWKSKLLSAGYVLWYTALLYGIAFLIAVNIVDFNFTVAALPGLGLTLIHQLLKFATNRKHFDYLNPERIYHQNIRYGMVFLYGFMFISSFSSRILSVEMISNPLNPIIFICCRTVVDLVFNEYDILDYQKAHRQHQASIR